MASHGHTNTDGTANAIEWCTKSAISVAAMTVIASALICTAVRRVLRNPGASAAAAATTIATGTPSSISAVKITTNAGGMIAGSADARACTRRHAVSIAASTRPATSGARSVVTQPASQGTPVAAANSS